MFLLRNKLSKEECLKRLEAEVFERITLSFYKYVKIEDTWQMRNTLYEEWDELGIFGRVYVANEGINGQISIPEPNFEEFKMHFYAHSEFMGLRLNIAVEEDESFYKLMLKIRKQIVSDGLAEGSYDIENVGTHMDAAEFNDAIDDPESIVVDMRNFYESRIGHFDGAICPDTPTFQEELPMVRDILKGKEDKKILLYCTGGIRCEKTSAYLKHYGFKDVNQLNGGIIKYTRDSKAQGLESKFKGKNFVFDERIAERITDDVLSECDQCDSACDDFTNCLNAACNLLFIQCESCAADMGGCCTQDCLGIAKLPAEEKKAYYAKQRSSTYDLYKSRIRPDLKSKDKVIE